jgi:hypothetical protein
MKTLWNKLMKWWRLDKPRFLPCRDFGAEPDDYCWEDYYRDAKAKFPIRYFLQETLPRFFRLNFTYPIDQFWYWIRSHTFDRYHVLSLKSPQNHYTWGWIDRDRAMLHACFNLLKDFVEKEMEHNVYYLPATEYCPEWDQRDQEKEIKELYQWWMTDRQKNMDNNPSYFYPKEGEECEDDVMLARLMKIRGYLWS